MFSRARSSFFVTGLCAAAAALALAQEPDDAKAGAVEPPLRLFAEHAGAEVPVTLDQPVTLGGVTFTLRARAQRHLQTADFAVEYPQNYHFEYEADDLDMWTLTGADASLMVFVAQQQMAPQDFLDSHVGSMQEQFPGSTVAPATMTLEGAAQRGKRVLMTIGGTRLTQEVYALATRGGGVLLLVVQDSPPDGQAASAEAGALKALVSRTFARRG